MVTVFDFKLSFSIIFIFGHVQSVVIFLETCKDSSLFFFIFYFIFFFFIYSSLLLLLLLLLIGLTFYVFCTALRVIVLLDRHFINIV